MTDRLYPKIEFHSLKLSFSPHRMFEQTRVGPYTVFNTIHNPITEASVVKPIGQVKLADITASLHRVTRLWNGDLVIFKESMRGKL